MNEQKPFCPSHPNSLCPMKEGKGRCELCGYDFSGQKLDRESRNAFWEQARLEGERKKAEWVAAQQAPDEDQADWDERLARVAKLQEPFNQAPAWRAYLNSRRFMISADGTEVADNITRLIWRRCVEGMAVSAGICIGTARRFTYDEALQHAKSESVRTGIAWRMPNKDELASLIDLNFTPTIDPKGFPATPIRAVLFIWRESGFWSSSPIEPLPYVAMVVDFYAGGMYSGGFGDSYYVRLVRDGQ